MDAALVLLGVGGKLCSRAPPRRLVVAPPLAVVGLISPSQGSVWGAAGRRLSFGVDRGGDGALP